MPDVESARVDSVKFCIMSSRLASFCLQMVDWHLTHGLQLL